MKTLLPQPILDILNTLDDANRGQVFSAIFALIYNRVMPEPGAMTPAAYCVFQFYLREMGRKIERYHAAADRRNQRKAEKAAMSGQASGDSQQNTASIPAETLPAAAAHAPELPAPLPAKIERGKVPSDHILTMKKYAEIVRRRFPEKSKSWRDRQVSQYLHDTYPGLYFGITTYDSGGVILHPA